MIDPALAELADWHGIERGYYDIWGVWREASADTVRALLAAMGVAASGPREVNAALDTSVREPGEFALPPTVVLRCSALAQGVTVRLPGSLAGASLDWRITEEGGRAIEGRARIGDLRVTVQCAIGGARRRAVLLPLPSVPGGYHRLEIFDGPRPLAASSLIVAPERCYLPGAAASGIRLWGASVQLYGLRSGRNWGIGDFGDLAEAVAQWASRGAAFVGVNPLHALFASHPDHASPYSPSSRLFLNPIYLDVEAVEEFAECATAKRLTRSKSFRRRLDRLRMAGMVDYPGVAAAKHQVLELLYTQFRESNPRHAVFAEFCRRGGEALRRHALYETLNEHFLRIDASAGSWLQWPEPYRDPASAEVAQFALDNVQRTGYFLYLQWQAALQLAAAETACRKSGLAIGLYLDLAVSVDRGGADAWAHQDLFALGVSIGAPPDDFTPEGQDWGLPPFNPAALQRTGYAFFIETLLANMAAAGALRIDHVMGLARLFWLPLHGGAAQGAYVRYPLDDLLAIIALESQRNRCMVIGEDLGTVPVQLRHALREWGVLSYRLMMFERDSAGRFQPPSDYPAQSLVAFSTHDLPTFIGYWQAQDAPVRQALLSALRESGLLPEDASDRAGLSPETLARLSHAVHLHLARSPALVLSVQIEDCTGASGQANLPGTPDQAPNWRRKLPATLEEMHGDARLKGLGDELSAARGAAAGPAG